MRVLSLICVFVFPLMFLSSCGNLELVKAAFQKIDFWGLENQGYYKVGNPYRIDGRWYHPKIEPDYVEEGVASWYGDKFHKKITANGEVFDKREITAAHRTLPLPSVVKVTNLKNGKSLIMRVNDRGPFAHDRIIDLSEAAAERLGFREQGTVKVRVEFDEKRTKILLSKESEELFRHHKGKTPPAMVAKDNDLNISKENAVYVQVGAYGSYKAARDIKNRLDKTGEDVKIQDVDVRGKTLFRVRLGFYGDINEADEVLNKVVKLGFEDAIIVKM